MCIVYAILLSHTWDKDVAVSVHRPTMSSSQTILFICFTTLPYAVISSSELITLGRFSLITSYFFFITLLTYYVRVSGAYTPHTQCGLSVIKMLSNIITQYHLPWQKTLDSSKDSYITAEKTKQNNTPKQEMSQLTT